MPLILNKDYPDSAVIRNVMILVPTGNRTYIKEEPGFVVAVTEGYYEYCTQYVQRHCKIKKIGQGKKAA